MRNMQRWRWLAVYMQTALVAGLPFVYIGGESALRFDIPTMRLLLFGSKLWVGELYVVLLASLIFFVLIIAFTLVLGRVWCGWACPQTVIGEYVGLLRSALKARKSDPAPVKAAKAFAFHLSLAVLCAFVSANLIWYFVSPYEMLPMLFTWSMGPITRSFFLVMAVSFYAHFVFLGQRFCGTICPYSKWQSVLLDRNSLIIAFNKERADECMGCNKCVTVCPTGIDIKDGLQVECINCAKCVDVCREMTSKRGKMPIVGYVFGDKSGTLGNAVTPKFLLFAAVAVVLSMMLVYRMAARETVTLQVVKGRQSLYRVADDGSVTNYYGAFITNRGDRDASYEVAVSGIEGAVVAMRTAGVAVRAGERRLVPFEVQVPAGSGHGSMKIAVTVRDTSTGNSAESDAGFILP